MSKFANTRFLITCPWVDVTNAISKDQTTQVAEKTIMHNARPTKTCWERSVFAARALVVIFMNAVCPARALVSGTQNSILPARAHPI